MNRAKMIGYWTTTSIIAFAWLSGGVADHRPETLQGMVELGYPPYVLTILGFWKVLGAVAVLAPRFPRLKEWAYAGTFFELSGAVASHAMSRSSLSHLIWPGFFAVCTLVSWALRPQSRVVGVLFQPRPGTQAPPQLVHRRGDLAGASR